MWVQAALATSASNTRSSGGCVDVITSATLSLFSTSIPRAAAMRGDDLRMAVTRAYSAIADGLLAHGGLHPVRFWNFLPSPSEQMGDGLDRYMVFNAGRYDAYAQWYGTPREFSHSLATASAVGVMSDDYVLYCLASVAPGIPVENPRQTSAWRYSRRYGPKPPCFARATIARIDGRDRLLIGGTASIVGEDSLHIGDADAQVQETLCNITALLAAANGTTTESRSTLERLTSVRIYIRDSTDAAIILSAVEQKCRDKVDVEAAIAEVCRPELLVEIEAVADL
jgi:enamine deaminase RidA (YjgF/YER057c/UK114 family)